MNIHQLKGKDFAGELSPEATSIILPYAPSDPDSFKIEDTDLALARSEHGLAKHEIALPTPTPSVQDLTIPAENKKITIRTYTPQLQQDEPLPIFIYAHGGCWAFCSLDSHNRICHYIAHHAQCIVVSVDYALAPEHPFPTGLNDYYNAILWCHENASTIGANPSKMAVGGDSAGGNLAAVAAQKLANETKIPLSLQVLIYPICDVPAPHSPSIIKYAEDYFFTLEMLEWTASLYIQSPDIHPTSNPLISPIAGNISPSLSPAFFVIAECDVLRDQGIAYAEKLHQNNIKTKCIQYQGMPHAFVAMAGSLSLGKQALDDCAYQLKNAFKIEKN